MEKPAAVTPEGVRVLTGGTTYAWMSLCFLAFFNMMGVFVVPKFMEIFQQVRVPIPGLTILFLNVSSALRSTTGIVISLLLLGLMILVPRRVRIPQPVLSVILVGSVTVCFAMLLSLFLPLVSLLEGVGVRHR